MNKENLGKVQFRLVRTELDNWYWTCILPTQIKHFRDRKAAITAMAKVIKRIQSGNFPITEHDLLQGTDAVDLKGGVRFILALLRREAEKEEIRKTYVGKKRKKKSKKQSCKRA